MIPVVASCVAVLSLTFAVATSYGSETIPAPPNPNAVNSPLEPAEQVPLEFTDESLRAIRPAVFLFLRRKAPIDRDEIQSLIRAATECLSDDGESVIGPWVENIVLIEEEDYWVISFHGRANGRVVHKNPVTGQFEWFVGTVLAPVIVYLENEGLNRIEPPEGMKLISPAFQDPFPLEIGITYPSESEAEAVFRIGDRE